LRFRRGEEGLQTRLRIEAPPGRSAESSVTRLR
jgi:hypothetical protein